MPQALVCQWFRPAPRIITAWFGPDGAVALQASQDWRDPESIPTVIGPPGPKGDPGPEGPMGDITTDLLAHYILAKN